MKYFSFLAPFGLLGAAFSDTAYDLLIQKGKIVDGAGNPWFHGDLAVCDGRIVILGKVPASAKWIARD